MIHYISCNNYVSPYLPGVSLMVLSPYDLYRMLRHPYRSARAYIGLYRQMSGWFRYPYIRFMDLWTESGLLNLYWAVYGNLWLVMDGCYGINRLISRHTEKNIDWAVDFKRYHFTPHFIDNNIENIKSSLGTLKIIAGLSVPGLPNIRRVAYGCFGTVSYDGRFHDLLVFQYLGVFFAVDGVLYQG